MDNKTINFNIDTTKTNPIYLPYLVKENDALEINVSIFENNQKVNLTFNDVFITFRNSKTNDLFYEKEANETDENIAIFIVNSSVLNQTGEIIGDIVIKRRLKQVTSNNFIFKVLPANAQRVLEGAEKYIQTWAELRELITEANKMLEENKEVFEILGENKDSLTALGEINKLLDSKIDKITETTGTADEKINSLTSLNSQAQQNIQNLINLGSNINFANVAGELGNLKEDLKNLKTDSAANEKVITELRQKIKEIENKIKEINTSGGSGSSSDEEIKEILSMIYQNQENIKNNSTSISNLQKTDTELSSFTNSLNNSVKSINTEITKIKEDIESLKNNNANNSGNNTGNTGTTTPDTGNTGNQTPETPSNPATPPADNDDNLENALPISELREEFHSHRDTMVSNENGVHGIRYKDKKLSAYNKETQTWDIISTDNIIVPPTTEGGGTGGDNTGAGSGGGSTGGNDETVTQGGKYKVMSYGMSFEDNRNYDNFVDYLRDIKDFPAQSPEIKKFLGWYPCIVKDGKEIARLHPDNYNLLENGESADTVYQDKCLKMICFPRRGFKFTNMGGVIEVSVTNNPNAPNYDYTAFQNYGKDYDCFYLLIDGVLNNSDNEHINNIIEKNYFDDVYFFISRLKELNLPYNVFSFRQATYLSTIYLLYYKNNKKRQNWFGMNDANKRVSVIGFCVKGTDTEINYLYRNDTDNALFKYNSNDLPKAISIIPNKFYEVYSNNTSNKPWGYIGRIIGNNQTGFLPGGVVPETETNKFKFSDNYSNLPNLTSKDYPTDLSRMSAWGYAGYVISGTTYGDYYYYNCEKTINSSYYNYKKLQCFGNEIDPETFNPDAPTGSTGSGSNGSTGSGSINPEHGEKLTEFLNTLLKDVNKNKEDIEELFDLIDDIEIGEGGGSSGGGSNTVITPDLTSIRNDLTRLETKLTEAERNITTLQAEHEEINLKIETNKTQIDLNVDEINEIRKDIANLGTGEGASADLTEIEAEIESLKTDVEKNTADILNIKNDIKYEKAEGTANAIILNLPENLEEGFIKYFIAKEDNNSEATTINNIPLYKANTTEAPELKENTAYQVYYLNDCFFLIEKSKLDLTGVTLDNANQMLADASAYDKNGNLITGLLKRYVRIFVYANDKLDKISGAGDIINMPLPLANNIYLDNSNIIQFNISGLLNNIPSDSLRTVFQTITGSNFNTGISKACIINYKPNELNSEVISNIRIVNSTSSNTANYFYLTDIVSKQTGLTLEEIKNLKNYIFFSRANGFTNKFIITVKYTENNSEYLNCANCTFCSNLLNQSFFVRVSIGSILNSVGFIDKNTSNSISTGIFIY